MSPHMSTTILTSMQTGCVSPVQRSDMFQPLKLEAFLGRNPFVLHTDDCREKPHTSDTSQPQTAPCVEQTEAHYGSPFSMTHQGQLGGERGRGSTIRLLFSSPV